MHRNLTRLLRSNFDLRMAIRSSWVSALCVLTLLVPTGLTTFADKRAQVDESQTEEAEQLSCSVRLADCPVLVTSSRKTKYISSVIPGVHFVEQGSYPVLGIGEGIWPDYKSTGVEIIYYWYRGQKRFRTVRYIPPKRVGASVGISKDGSTILCSADNGEVTPIHACRFSDADGLTDLGTLDPANNASLASFGYGVNGDGTVVVGMSDLPRGTLKEVGIGGMRFWPDAIQHAFRWTLADGMVDLGSANGSEGFSRALGTSGDGSVIVGESDFATASDAGGRSIVRRAFRWTQGGGFQGLGELQPRGSSMATTITADGSVVVGNAQLGSSYHAFRWAQADGMQDIGSPLTGRLSSATATAVSDNGKVIVGMSAPRGLSYTGLSWDAGSDTRAFRWTPSTGIQDLTQLVASKGIALEGRTLIAALAVSPDGQFIGGAMSTGEENETEGFILQMCDDAVEVCTAQGATA